MHENNFICYHYILGHYLSSVFVVFHNSCFLFIFLHYTLTYFEIIELNKINETKRHKTVGFII